MHAVDAKRARPEHIRQSRLGLDADFVREIVTLKGLPAERKVVVFDRILLLLGDVLIERSARRNVDQLHAATDAQHWFPVGDGPGGKRQLDAVALTIRLVARSEDR